MCAAGPSASCSHMPQLTHCFPHTCAHVLQADCTTDGDLLSSMRGCGQHQPINVAHNLLQCASEVEQSCAKVQNGMCVR